MSLCFFMVSEGGFSVPGSILIVTGALTFIDRTFLLPFHVALLRFVQIGEMLEDVGCSQAGSHCIVSCLDRSQKRFLWGKSHPWVVV
jgi:hypothetical protein